MTRSFIGKFQNFNFRNKLYGKGNRIIIALSGGPDSTALILVFSKLAKKYDLKLLAIHINYGLRKIDSDKDEKFSRELSKKLGIKLKVLKYKKFKNRKGNLEENLRKFRYKIFEEERQKNKFDLIATAHTLDDQVETFFINLLRGAGGKGLTGLKTQRGNIIRPLLFAEKKEILTFLKKSCQESRIDKSNFDTSLTRNHIRLKLIPYIERNYNPNIKMTISKTISILEDQNKMVDLMVKEKYSRLLLKGKEHVVFSKNSLKKLSPFLLKKIFRQAIMDLSGNLRNIELSHFLEFNKTLCSQKSKKKIIKIRNILIKINNNCVVFTKIKNNSI